MKSIGIWQYDRQLRTLIIFYKWHLRVKVPNQSRLSVLFRFKFKLNIAVVVEPY
jgi:hypothetical protein